MKPDTRTAMTRLIRQARIAMPLEQLDGDICSDECNGCSVKLLEFVRAELDNWESRIEDGVIPNLGEIDKLAKTCRKVHKVLQKNGLV